MTSLILFSKKSKYGKFKLYFWLPMPKLGQTSNKAVYPFFVIENTNAKVRLIFYVLK
jgi:hypothetical protein